MLVYSGDPKLYLDEDGSDLVFEGGQPDIDQGVENRLSIALFTRPNWPGNTLFDDPAEQIGSDFQATAQQPITINTLNDIRDSVIKALADGFGTVSVDVTNPLGNRIDVLINLPGTDLKVLLTTKNGINWQFQIDKGVS